MLRAVIGAAFGPPQSYRLVNHDPGRPGPGEVRVSIKAAGVSYVDVLTAKGEYQFKPPLPGAPIPSSKPALPTGASRLRKPMMARPSISSSTPSAVPQPNWHSARSAMTDVT